MEEIIMTSIVGLLMIGGGLFVINSAIAMFRVHDAYERLSAMTPATGLGLPLIVIGVGVEHTWEYRFEWEVWGRVAIIVTAMVLVSSVGSNVLGRAVYMSGAPLDPKTMFNDLAEEPAWLADPSSGNNASSEQATPPGIDSAGGSSDANEPEPKTSRDEE